mgnify:CR=1 FL=1
MRLGVRLESLGKPFRAGLAVASAELGLFEFDVQEGTDVLLKAAKTNRDPREERVRDSAIQAIAVRAYNLSKLNPPIQLATAELEPTLLQLAADTDPVIRFQTAYTLGHIGTPAAVSDAKERDQRASATLWMIEPIWKGMWRRNLCHRR